MGGHPGGADEHAEAVLPGVPGEVRGGGGGAVGAQNVGLIGDAEVLELGAGPFDHRPIGVGAHDDGDFFHSDPPLENKTGRRIRAACFNRLSEFGRSGAMETKTRTDTAETLQGWHLISK